MELDRENVNTVIDQDVPLWLGNFLAFKFLRWYVVSVYAFFIAGKAGSDTLAIHNRKTWYLGLAIPKSCLLNHNVKHLLKPSVHNEIEYRQKVNGFIVLAINEKE